VIIYSFYKNIVLTMILFYYTFYTGFSGQSLFEDYVYTGYNFFLAMPIITIGIFDRDISEVSALHELWGRRNLL
jgi:phospholipid-transporting ATPase